MPQFPLTRQSLLMLAVSQPLLFSSVQLQAADDDRVVAQNGTHVSVSDMDIETTGDAVYGLVAESGAIVNAHNMSLGTSGGFSFGAFINGYDSKLNATGDLAITTSGENSAGLLVGNYAKADVEKIDVVTVGESAFGLFVASNAQLNLGSGSITTRGDDSIGIRGWQRGEFKGANLVINTEGNRAFGVRALTEASVNLRGSSISTFGDQSAGVFAGGGSSIDLSTGASITTYGTESHGAFASGANSLVKLSDSHVETFGEGSAGIQVEDGGRVELNNAHVKANGAGAVGAQLSGGSLAVNGGSIQSQNGAVINIRGQGNTVDVAGAYLSSTDGLVIQVEGASEALVTVRNGSTLSANNGTGELLGVKLGSGLDLVVDGSFLHGNMTIPEGSLVNVRLQNGTRLTGQMADVRSLQLDAGVSWNITGDSNVESLVLGGGAVNFAGFEGFHQLTVGELSGNGDFGLKLDINNRRADFLAVDGQASGRHRLNIHNSGIEPPAGFDPVQVVHTEGGDAVFNVVGERVDLGAYSYGIERLGDDWFLVSGGREVSPATRSVQALFNSAPTVWYGEMSALRSRMNEVRSSGQGGGWMLGYGNKHQVAGSDGLRYKQNQAGFSLGADTPLDSSDGVLMVGLLAGHSKSGLSQARGSAGTVQSFYVGGYGTWMGSDGYYVDGLLKLNQFQNRADVVMSNSTKAKGTYRNYGVGASLEAGREVQLTERLFVEPFVQVSAVAVQGKSLNLDSGLQARSATTRSLLGKVGATVEHRNQWVSPYVKVALAHEFARDNEVKVNGNSFRNDLQGTRAELGAGLSLSVAKDLQLHANFEYMNGTKIKQPWGGSVGLRYAF